MGKESLDPVLPADIERIVLPTGRKTFRHRDMFKKCRESGVAEYKGILIPFRCSLFQKSCSSYACHEGFGF